MRDLIYFDSSRFSSFEEAASIRVWDATSAGIVGSCPRKAYYQLVERKVPAKQALFLKAGKVFHAALDLWYLGTSVEEVLEFIASQYEESTLLPAVGQYSHLTGEFLMVVFKNYVNYAKKNDTFWPLKVKVDQLHTEKVAVAQWRLTDDNLVVLGESSVVLDLGEGEEPFYYGMKPDMPILAAGNQVFLLDTKTTSSYIGKSYLQRYKVSNQLRAYCYGLSLLLGKEITGAVVNAIHLGPKAVESSSNVTRFERYGPLLFPPSVQREAIENLRAWAETLDRYAQSGYYPQHTGVGCSSCDYLELCSVSPSLRQHLLQVEFVEDTWSFFSKEEEAK